jgi:predicted hydrocarbon binding protein
MSIFDKLAAIKQINFKDGEITLMSQRVMFIPNEVSVGMTQTLIKNHKMIAPTYESIKKEFNNGWSKNLKKNYGFDPRKFMEQLIELANLSGWGINKLEEFNAKNKTGVFSITNSPTANYFKGQTKEPVDHFIRALYAGGASTVFGDDIDWIETECIAQGKPKCKLVFGPKKQLLKKYPEFKYQIE